MLPDAGEPLSDPFLDFLSDYDRALAAGHTPAMADPSTQSEELQQRLSRARSCLERLEQDRRERLLTVSQPLLATTPSGGARFGRFEVERVLGSGGFGIVYLARDPLLDRRVALKVPRPEVLISLRMRQQFVREARATARLSHASIVPVFDSGEIGPFCYLVTEYCEHGSLADWLRSRTEPVPIRQAAVLVADLAEAMQHAHERGILHCDLKPGNILLVGPTGCQPAANDVPSSLLQDFVPRIVDFGLARIIEEGEEDRERTQSRTLVGTPRYMAPEQADPRLGRPAAATDIHALGAILYELLVGKPAFAGSSQVETLRRIVEDEVPSPRRLRPEIPRDLAAICAKCLEKRPPQRYFTAGELARDLRRYLAGRSTLARPLPAWEKLERWIRRRPAVAGATGLAVGCILAFLVEASWHYTDLRRYSRELAATAQREQDQRVLAEEQARIIRRRAYASNITMLDSLRRAGEPGLLWELLNQYRASPAEEDLRDFAWGFLWNQGRRLRHLRGHERWVTSLALSDNGRDCITTALDRTVRRWNTDTGQLVETWSSKDPNWYRAYLTPDGSRLLAIVGPREGPWSLVVHDASGTVLAREPSPFKGAPVTAITTDGEQVAFGGESAEGTGEVLVWHLKTGQIRSVWQADHRSVTALGFSSDGHQLALACSNPGVPSGNRGVGVVVVCDLVTGAEPHLLVGHEGIIAALAFSPDKQTLASGSWDRTVRLWNLPKHDTTAVLTGFPEEVCCLVFNQDGRVLAVGTRAQDRALKPDVTVWDVSQAIRLPNVLHPESGVNALMFLPNDTTLAVGCADGHVSLWEWGDFPEFHTWQGHRPAEAWSVDFTPDSKTLVSGGDDHALRIWDVKQGKERACWIKHNALISSLAVSPDGRFVATGSYDKTVKLWELSTGTVIWTAAHDRELRRVVFSPDGRFVASGSKDRTARIWDVVTGECRAVLTGAHGAIAALAFRKDGLLLAGDLDYQLRLWDPQQNKVVITRREEFGVDCAAFTPDDKLLVTGIKNGLVHIWNLAETSPPRDFRGHLNGTVRSLAITQDGRTLATAGEDKVIRLWQLSTGQELLSFRDQPDFINTVVFSPDGRYLAAALHDGSLRLWRAAKVE